jgi:hypothetical protein
MPNILQTGSENEDSYTLDIINLNLFFCIPEHLSLLVSEKVYKIIDTRTDNH